MSNKILFILKHRESYGLPYGYTLSSGLYNSANFVCQMLQRNNVNAKLVEVVDNNSIDKEVTLFQPDIVIIEAYWVVPEKFDTLANLHPNVKWVVRAHSELPFLANEGIAMDWTKRYYDRISDNLMLAFNSKRTRDDIANILSVQFPDALSEDIDSNIIYLPNYYPVTNKEVRFDDMEDGTIDVGCFGAIRPMKNHLTQAVAALKYADDNGLNLNFHINKGRIERGDEVYKNLVALFNGLPSPRYNLIEHKWLKHSDFIKVVRQMDIGLQVSFSETFNIVAADLVDNGIPIVTSNQIKWVSSRFYADPTDVNDIVKKISRAINFKRLSPIDINKKRLKKYCQASKSIWLDFCNE